MSAARRTKPHADAKLSLRECYDKHYDKSELSPATIGGYDFALRLWERLTGNPPVGTITNETLATFRAKSIEHGHAPATTNRIWTSIRAMLYRIGPKERGNPWGLSIIPDVPIMKPLKEPRKTPRRVSLEDLDKFYIACKHAKRPKSGPPAAWWWQALLVVAYFTGMRRSDLFALRFDQIDFERRVISFNAEKTGKYADFPLHAIAAEHLKRIQTPREMVFSDMAPWNGDFYTHLKRLCDLAKVERFRLHDMRRTGASECERSRPGMAAVFLQHKMLDVTHASYLNQMEELGEAIEGMRTPVTFRQGIGLSERGEKQRKKDALKWQECLHSRPYTPDPSEWSFDIGAVRFRGKWHPWREAAPKRALEMLAKTPRPVTVEELGRVIWGDHPEVHYAPRRVGHNRGKPHYSRVHGCINVVRRQLRAMLLLPEDWDPVPCLERGNGGRWCLLFPPEPQAAAGC